jgi:ribonucleotide monophosphatase NagD (HAD superfamily)
MRLAPGEIVIVGDDPALEIELGRGSGSPTVLTLTGITDASAVGRLPPEQRPDVVVRDAGELRDLLRLPAA